MEKATFLHEQGLSQNYPTQNRCVNYNKSEFATKQRKTTMSKKGPPHNYRGNNYVISYLFLLFEEKVKKNTKLKTMSITPRSAKLQHNSLL